MNIKYSKALLMSGAEFNLTPSITLRHPIIRDILSINTSIFPDNVYWTYVNILLSDPYTNMVMLDDMGKNYLEVSPYEVFVLQWNANSNPCETNNNSYHYTPLNTIQNALQFFIKEKHHFEKGLLEDGTVIFYDKDNPQCQIDRNIFEYIYEWVKSINNIDFSNRIKPADENARRILIEDMRDEIKKAKRRKKKNEDNINYLGNIMAAASFCSNGTITPFNINECKIYWINQALAINSKKSNADHILDGIYHGTINSKDINKKDLNWINN